MTESIRAWSLFYISSFSAIGRSVTKILHKTLCSSTIANLTMSHIKTVGVIKNILSDDDPLNVVKIGQTLLKEYVFFFLADAR